VHGGGRYGSTTGASTGGSQQTRAAALPAIVNHDNSADDSTRNVSNADGVDGVDDERAVDEDSDDDNDDR
jgi:hypothetical protein